MRAILELGRIGNAALAAAAVVVGAATEWKAVDAAFASDIGLAALAALLGTFGGNVLNDIRDIAIDRRAHPGRPLPSARASLGTARVTLAVAWTTSVLLAFVVSRTLGAFALGLIALLVLYELLLKSRGLVGNAAVAVAGGALFPFGAWAIGAPPRLSLFLGLLAVLAHFGREILKDAEDAEADRATRRTFAVTRGVRAAGIVAAASLVAAVLLSPLPLVVADWEWWFLAAVAPADAVFLWAAWQAPTRPGRARAAAKLAMALAVAAFAAGALL